MMHVLFIGIHTLGYMKYLRRTRRENGVKHLAQRLRELVAVLLKGGLELLLVLFAALALLALGDEEALDAVDLFGHLGTCRWVG
jgi:hypothetical protein